MSTDNKKKFALWLYPETQEQIRRWYRQNNCQSQSEFIEKAVNFYIGYIASVQKNEYLPPAISSAIQGAVGSVENKLSRRLFQQSVELAMMMNVLAMAYEIDADTLSSLRGKSVREVKLSNGGIRFDEIVREQHRETDEL